MENRILGLHHITAIADNANRNLAFYTQVLGLRLVKKTVNFDDPGTYHFYFGNEEGTPGTILTFFPWGRNWKRNKWFRLGNAHRIFSAERKSGILEKQISTI